MHTNNKSEIRETILKERSKLTAIEKKALDKLIFKNIIESSIFKEAKVIFIFVSFKDEVNTHNIINYALELGKRICVPRVVNLKSGMEVLYINSLKELTKNKMGILEPKDSVDFVKKEDIDLAIVPGLAFDLQGGRLGYGGGFYDRYFENSNFKKLAIGYEFQIIDSVPKEKHDKLIDGIFTENTFKSFN